MKRILFLVIACLSVVIASACPVCERNKPKVLRGIAHGAGPESNWDYVIVWSVVAIVIFTLVYSIKALIKPGEKDVAHIKRTVLDF
jgi:hypothetical protein